MKNLQPIYHFSEQTHFTAEDHLLMELGDAGASIMRYHPENRMIAGLIVYHNIEETGISFEEILQSMVEGVADHRIRIFIDDAQSLLVPLLNHQPALNQSMLELAFGSQEYRNIHQDQLLKLNLVNVYSLPDTFEKQLKKSLSHYVSFRHSTSAQVSKEVGGHQLHVSFFYNSIKIIVHENGKLFLCHRYEFNQPEDLLYRLVHLCQELHWQPQNVTLTLSGQITTDDAIFRILYDYFDQLLMLEHQDWDAKHPGIKSLPGHFFSHLISLATCE